MALRSRTGSWYGNNTRRPKQIQIHRFVLLLTAAALFGCAPKPIAAPDPLSDQTSVIGTTFIAATESGEKYTMRVDDVVLDTEDKDRDLSLYKISVYDENKDSWYDLCAPDSKGIALAIPFQGIWDSSGRYIESDSLVTFGCTSGVLAKCVRWGYKPWKKRNGISLAKYHQACTRMARADYCGDGQHHTREGTEINIFDDLGIQNRDPNLGTTFEAAWDENGATYVSHARWFETLAELKAECPHKLKGRTRDDFVSDDVKEIRKQMPSSLLFNESFIRRVRQECRTHH